jgi:flagellar M-ring protein FliF
VISAPFQGEEKVEPMRTPLLEQPWLWNAGKLLLAAVLGLVLILSVVRPLIRGLLSPQARPASHERADEDQLRLPAGAAVAQLPAPGPEPVRLPGDMSYEEALTAARQVVSQEPAVAASVVRNWLGDDD